MRASNFAAMGAVLVGFVACDRNGRDLLPPVSEEFPPVVEYDEIQIMSSDAFDEFQASDDPWAWCATTDDQDRPRCIFGQVSSPPAGVNGGATFNFKGNGEKVCVITDPEAVFWNTSISVTSRKDNFAYPDNYSDDGDIDLFAGLSSYYTGSPGVELGDFKGYYTDSLGREVEIEYGECTQQGANTGQNDAHAGRGQPEYCAIDTDERDGILFTVVLKTWSTPLDDGLLSFGAMVVEGTCRSLNPSECTIMGEALDQSGNLRTCSDRMELAYCKEELQGFCCANPEMCGEHPADDVCEEFDRATFCSENEELCCESK